MEMLLLLTVMPVGLIGTLYWLERDADEPGRPSDNARSRRQRG